MRTTMILKFRMMMMVVVVSWMMMMISTVAASTTTTTTTTTKSMIISQQQQSISNAVRDLQKYQQEQNIDDPNRLLLSCIMIPSRSVTLKQRQQIINDILQINKNDDDSANNNKITINQLYKAIATSDGMVFVQPSSVLEAVQMVSIVTNNIPTSSILYHPDPIDVQRGEGLMDTFGPVLEAILQQQTSSTTTPFIYVLIPNGMESSLVQTQIEHAIQQLLPYFIINDSTTIIAGSSSSSSSSSIGTKINPTSTTTRNVQQLRDSILSKIVYTTPQLIRTTLLQNDVTATSSSDIILPHRMSGSSISSISSHNTFDIPQHLAASNVLRPIAQQQYQNIVSALQRTCFTTTTTATDAVTNTKVEMKFVPNFGELCDAIVTKEMAFWYDTNTSDNSTIDLTLRKSIIGRQICAKLYDDVFMYILTNIYMEQINKLQKMNYDTFKKDLSKLVISPNLPTDMNRIGQASISTFITDTIRLIPKTSFVSSHYTSYLTSYATSVQRIYIRKVQEYIQNRILLAKASGKFRPIPRKGITIGMHYLLPKPFGNDYRQEPSMIHATDNMVYIPKTAKLSDANTDQIASGSDWKDSIVPHPPGNDMLYMQ